MWVNALFRNEYLFISTKGEYNHPHKVRGLKFNDNLGLTLGLMAHTIISDINKQLEGGYE